MKARASLHTLSLLILFQAAVQAQQWETLFDGRSFSHWTHQNKAEVNAPAWSIDDGWMHLDRSNGRGGNLISKEVYGDFELLFEWRVAEKANNGIKYRVNDFDGKTLGLEYQVIDDFNNPKLRQNHKTASIYDIYEVKDHEVLRPAGESNFGRILVRKDRIEHWLNGHLVAEATVGSQEWNDNIAKSKFRDVTDFGATPVGRIMITDHNDEVWYRNIFVRRLDVEIENQLASSATIQGTHKTACGEFCTQPPRVRFRPRRYRLRCR